MNNDELLELDEFSALGSHPSSLVYNSNCDGVAVAVVTS